MEGEDEIIIDDLNYNKNKIHLFSTEFLIVNGLKRKIEENDFQVFNNDNCSIDLFSKFLRKIINEINNSIIKNNFENDFLKKHSVKLNINELDHFISAKLNYNDKEQLNQDKNKIESNNLFIKIKCIKRKKKSKAMVHIHQDIQKR